jgi:hypothetical protein
MKTANKKIQRDIFNVCHGTVRAVQNCIDDEGRSLGIGMRVQISNHPKLLR